MHFDEGAAGPIVVAPTTAPFAVLVAGEAGYGARQFGQYEYDDDRLSSVELQYRSQEGVWLMSVHTHAVATDAFLRPTVQSLLDYRVVARAVGGEEPMKVPEIVSVAGNDYDAEFRRYRRVDIAAFEIPGNSVIAVVERSRDLADRRVKLAVIEPGQPLTSAT